MYAPFPYAAAGSELREVLQSQVAAYLRLVSTPWLVFIWRLHLLCLELSAMQTHWFGNAFKHTVVYDCMQTLDQDPFLQTVTGDHLLCLAACLCSAPTCSERGTSAPLPTVSKKPLLLKRPSSSASPSAVSLGVGSTLALLPGALTKFPAEDHTIHVGVRLGAI